MMLMLKTRKEQIKQKIKSLMIQTRIKKFCQTILQNLKLNCEMKSLSWDMNYQQSLKAQQKIQLKIHLNQKHQLEKAKRQFKVSRNSLQKVK